jgi:predicted metal-dependent hydrolase
MSSFPIKRDPDAVAPLHEPQFTAVQRERFAAGCVQFNADRFWHAHEAWEEVWKGMGDGPEDDAELFLRGLIQLASALHQRARGRRAAMCHLLEKAEHLLAAAPDSFLGLDVVALRVFAAHQRIRSGEHLSFFLRRS